MENGNLVILREELEAANLSFKGAVRKRPIPPEDWAKVYAVARECEDMLINQAITVACGIYFELLDERKKK